MYALDWSRTLCKPCLGHSLCVCIDTTKRVRNLQLTNKINDGNDGHTQILVKWQDPKQLSVIIGDFIGYRVKVIS